MSLDIKTYEPRPPQVQIVEVTKENYKEVAAWMGDVEITTVEFAAEGESPWIKVSFKTSYAPEPIEFIFHRHPRFRRGYHIKKENRHTFSLIDWQDIAGLWREVEVTTEENN